MRSTPRNYSLDGTGRIQPYFRIGFLTILTKSPRRNFYDIVELTTENSARFKKGLAKDTKFSTE